MARRKTVVEDGYTYRVEAWNVDDPQPTVRVTCYEGEHPNIGFFGRLFKSSTSVTRKRVGLENTIEQAKKGARAQMRRAKRADDMFE